MRKIFDFFDLSAACTTNDTNLFFVSCALYYILYRNLPYPNSSVTKVSTYRHLSAFTEVYDVNVLILLGVSASGVAGVAETTRLVNLAIASESFIVISANFSPRIDFFVAYLNANTLGGVFVDGLK